MEHLDACMKTLEYQWIDFMYWKLYRLYTNVATVYYTGSSTRYDKDTLITEFYPRIIYSRGIPIVL